VPLYTVMPPTKTGGHGSNAATTDGRALALVRRIWSLRGLPPASIGQPDSGQIEMAQNKHYRTAGGQFKAEPPL